MVEAVLTTRSLAGAAAAVIERGRPRLPVLAARAAGRPAVRGSVVTPPLLYQAPPNFLSQKYLFVLPLLKCLECCFENNNIFTVSTAVFAKVIL